MGPKKETAAQENVFKPVFIETSYSFKSKAKMSERKQTMR